MRRENLGASAEAASSGAEADRIQSVHPDSRPLVVHLIDELPPDGAERLLADILEYRSPEFRYRVVCVVAGGPMEAEIATLGVPVEILGCAAGFSVQTLATLIRWMRAARPTVVHTHLFSADTYGRLAARLAGVSAVFSTRHNTQPWKGSFRRVLYSSLAPITTAVIACGEEVGRHLIDIDRVPKRKVVVIPNGVNLRRVSATDGTKLRHELGIPASRPVLGVVGRLHPQKGHLDLLPVLRDLAREGLDFECLFAGEGELRTEIEAQIDRLGLVGRVRLLGLRKDIGSFLASIDVFVMPSRWEGLPMALLEAMASGAVCVCTRVGSIPSVVTDGTDGILVDAGDPDQLRDALRSALSGGLRRDGMGANAARTVESRFNAAHVAAAYERQYRNALGLPEPAPHREVAGSHRDAAGPGPTDAAHLSSALRGQSQNIARGTYSPRS